jgi:hypothetical protein
MQREMHQRREMTMREPTTMPMMAGHLRDQRGTDRRAEATYLQYVLDMHPSHDEKVL